MKNTRRKFINEKTLIGDDGVEKKLDKITLIINSACFAIIISLILLSALAIIN